MEDKRLLFITIYGDDFTWKTNYDKRYVGEVFRDEIVRQYPFLFTASIVAGDISNSKGNFHLELAREIFGFDNIEAASHSWSHPRDWRDEKIDLAHEIVDSVNFIDQKILPKYKKVKMFLWTGKTNPTEKALEIVDRLGIQNLNGNEIDKCFVQVGKYPHFMSRAYPDWHYMNLKEIWHGLTEQEKYRVLKSYNGKLDGFKYIIKYFKLNPYLPIHLWIHWYSIVRRESMDAIKFVLDWCLKQKVRSIFASEYISLIQSGEIEG